MVALKPGKPLPIVSIEDGCAEDDYVAGST
jgi:hypothetical protein